MRPFSPFARLRLRASIVVAWTALFFASQTLAQEEAGSVLGADDVENGVLSPEEQRVAELYSSIQWQEGPATADIGTIARIEVPEGYRFTGKEGAHAWAEITQNIPSDDELGVLMPKNPAEDWFVVFIYDDIGHVKDDERDSLDADAILQSIQQGTEAGNEIRRERGMQELSVTGWARPPAYDAKTNNLCWATNLVLKDHPNLSNVNYQTRLLGRTGVMNVTLVCSTEQLNGTVPVLEGMLTHYEFKEGQKYAEWKEGDKLATVGLTGLIAGGAAVVAAKSGVFAKLASVFAKAGKAILLVILGIGAAAAKLFRRSSTQAE